MPDTSTEIATISTRAVRGHERVDFWVDHVARTLVRIECSGKSSEGIDATLHKRDLGLFGACDIVVVTGADGAIRWYACRYPCWGGFSRVWAC